MSRDTLLLHADKLHALRVVGESTGLREAARRLGVAPSTLSEKIAALEAFFGRALVERRGGGRVALTSEGRALVAASAPSLDVLASLDPRTPGRTDKTLRVGAYESVALHVLPEALARLARRAPSMRIELRTGRHAELASAVARGELDCAVGVGRTHDSRLEEIQLGSDTLGVFRPTSIPEADARARVADRDWGGLAPGRDGHALFYRRFCEDAGLEGAPLFSCDSFEVLRAMATAGHRPVVLPSRLARAARGALREVVLSPRAATVGRHEFFLVRRRGLGTRLFTTFAEELQRAFC